MNQSADTITDFIHPGHVGAVVVPLDGRRPYTVIHPDFRRPPGMPKTDQEHKIKQALVRLMRGEEVEGAEFLARRFGVAYRFCDEEKRTAA